MAVLVAANAFVGFALIAVGLLYLVDGALYGVVFVTSGVLLCAGTLGALGRDPPRIGFAIMLTLLAGVAVTIAGLTAHWLLIREQVKNAGEPYANVASRSPSEASHTAAGAYDFAQYFAFLAGAIAGVLVIALTIRWMRTRLTSEIRD